MDLVALVEIRVARWDEGSVGVMGTVPIKVETSRHAEHRREADPKPSLARPVDRHPELAPMVSTRKRPSRIAELAMRELAHVRHDAAQLLHDPLLDVAAEPHGKVIRPRRREGNRSARADHAEEGVSSQSAEALEPCHSNEARMVRPSGLETR